MDTPKDSEHLSWDDEYPQPMLLKSQNMIVQKLQLNDQLEASKLMKSIIDQMSLVVHSDVSKRGKGMCNQNGPKGQPSYRRIQMVKSSTKGRPFGSYSKKTFECLKTNREAIECTRN